ncbi:hypothetical protein N8T08_003987 [Aspergillus melleus]|uniref:Uncharacterized protein n=1 Tax=Aspergillus melleus TaxID=138277 RepID=A0ACC3B6J1_9EURO|nr:hypothetical protein N8T08_003987 [Aspergillus melleus]
MPWSAQKCPFCPKKYANKAGLENHLLEYTGNMRLPADGYHEVFEIKQAIRRLYGEKYQPDQDRRYRCWTCCEIITSRRRFTEHVWYREHCGLGPDLKSSLTVRGKGSTSGRRWVLPFDEDKVLLSDDPFPFLDLPSELRVMVYRYLLCFDEVHFSGKSLQHSHIERRRDGLWWQHNPNNNLLAIMSVNRQIYHEARWTFYTENRFSFERFENLPVFLVGIGAENARLLRSVSCKTKSGTFKKYTDLIQSCVRQAADTERDTSSADDLQIQLVEDLYLNLPNPDTLKPSSLPFDWCDSCRLLRPDTPSVSDYPFRLRFTLRATLRHKGIGGVNTDQIYAVAYELCKQRTRENEETLTEAK